MKRRFVFCCLIAASFLVYASAASATLMRSDPFLVDLTGTGFGNVFNILTLQVTGTEAGGVSYDGTNDLYSEDADTNSNKTATWSISQLGWNSAANIFLIYNANEPGSSVSSTINELVLTLYDTDGNDVWNSGSYGPDTVSEVEQGTGTSGWGYRLDDAQVLALDTAYSDFSTIGNYRVGLYASITDTADGPDTWLVANLESENPPPAPVPEPATMLLFGTGLAGLVGFGRKKLFKK